MYFEISQQEAKERGESLRRFELCYVTDIEESYIDWDEEDPKPKVNPKYNEKTATHLAYFCDCGLENVWGDDVDDRPYEHNAGIPYDYYYTEKKERKTCGIISIPFGWNNSDSLVWALPKDHTYSENSAYSVIEINSGKVPWLWVAKMEYKKFPKAVNVMAGTSIPDFLKKLEEIEKLKENED